MFNVIWFDKKGNIAGVKNARTIDLAESLRIEKEKQGFSVRVLRQY